ncbi:MAG: molybdenum cofactor guanylyltransferase [Pedosphaera sp.]|nr:molybdenum cofactor guanylyltransferase [Pedosphaera sp.]
MKSAKLHNFNVEVFILAGGLSSRMGRDKAKLRLGRRTMLGHIRRPAKELGLPVRILRKDVISRCGPLGGIYTGLIKSRADAVLFLACDMPFVSAGLLEEIIESLGASRKAVFSRYGDLAGFPLLLRREACLPVVEEQIEKKEFSLQSLARVLKAKVLRPERTRAEELENINTPEELEKARERLRYADSK